MHGTKLDLVLRRKARFRTTTHMGRHLCQTSQDSEEIDFEEITLAEIHT